MIAFERPIVLALALPWVVAGLFFARLQLGALGWIEAEVSPRFRPLLSVHGRRSLRLHLLLLALLGLLLIAAAAGPTLPGTAESSPEGARVLIAVDASASMAATDAAGLSPDDEPRSRLEEGREIALGLVEGLPGSRFAVASFSGVATVHLPLAADRELVAEALRTLEVHTFYQNSGSSFAAALDAAVHLAGEEPEGLQVVLVSDGEQPFPEAYQAPLGALAAAGVPVHAAAVGSLEGQGRRIFDFRDVRSDKEPEEWRVLRRFTTRRVDEHLERIAAATGGRFTAASPGSVEELVQAVLEARPESLRVEHEEARQDLSPWLLSAFLAGFLLDALLLFRRRGGPDHRFDLEFLGEPPSGTGITRNVGKPRGSLRGRSATCLSGVGGEGESEFEHRPQQAPVRRALHPLLTALLVLVAACQPGLLGRAHRENEAGIALDGLGQHAAARPHYERSIAYGVRSEVPTTNLGRSVTLAGDYSEAHEIFQQALLLAPRLAEAHQGDGTALYRWGEAERDPRGCDLDRTLDLWRQARLRFTTVVQLAGEESDLGAGARADLAFLARRLAEAEKLAADPPPECEEESESDDPSGGAGQPPDAEDGGGGSGGGSPPPAGSGGEPPPPQGGGSGSSPPPPTPPPTGGGGGTSLTDEEEEQIRAALDRIRQEAQGTGKFYRRTLPEQFPRAAWENPEEEVWW